ncbi:hypothetical protein [Leisingera sp.]|uniref:hypothetical protein n=1 Tax=Leisingera sp. TaxID=1879318 RepID=UPI002B27360C|nr:hypothetical protein [Leisingera sp.]
MKAPARAFYSLFEASVRWEKSCNDIAGWSEAGHFRLLTGIQFAMADGQPIAGQVEVRPADIFQMVRLDGPRPTAMRVYRVRPVDNQGGDGEWVFVTDQNGEHGVEVSIHDIYIAADDYRRFEEDHEFGPKPRMTTRGQSKYDWESMYVAICKRLFSEGLPETAEELCKEMQDWFISRTTGDAIPDISTIRKKLKPVWQELRAEI